MAAAFETSEIKPQISITIKLIPIIRSIFKEEAFNPGCAAPFEPTLSGTSQCRARN